MPINNNIRFLEHLRLGFRGTITRNKFRSNIRAQQKKLKTIKRYWCTNHIKMKNNEFKKISIKNLTCYYFDDFVIFEDFGFDNIFLDEKSYENILIYEISYERFIGGFDKINDFTRVYDGIRYLVLFDPEKYDAIDNRIKYLISRKSGVT